MGFKQEAAQKLAELDERVGALEEIANRLGYGRTLRLSAPAEAPAARTATTTAASNTTGVDYGAVAFGLSELKRKVAALVEHVRNGSFSTQEVAQDYAGAVDYFADVFAKSDPSFNRDEFNRLAQR